MTGPASPIVMGVRGFVLGADEVAAITRLQPMGFMLFARNIESLEQVRALCDAMRGLCPGYVPLIGVDQEGGRVQRLKFAGKLPPARVLGEWVVRDRERGLEACRLTGLLLAAQVRDAGANWSLAPVLDVACAETHAIIGDRAFSDNPAIVTEAARAYMRGLEEGGTWACIKHLPGHGRAAADSHAELPRVDVPWATVEADGAPFRALADAPFAMTAHIRYRFEEFMGPMGAFDGPGTFHSGFLRKLREVWGIAGLMVADDVGMKALDGDYVSRLVRAHAAGCDVVLCCFSKLKHGMAGTVFDEAAFAAVAAANLPKIPDSVKARLAALVLPPAPTPDAVREAWARLHELWDDGPATFGYAWPA